MSCLVSNCMVCVLSSVGISYDLMLLMVVVFGCIARSTFIVSLVSCLMVKLIAFCDSMSIYCRLLISINIGVLLHVMFSKVSVAVFIRSGVGWFLIWILSVNSSVTCCVGTSSATVDCSGRMSACSVV